MDTDQMPALVTTLAKRVAELTKELEEQEGYPGIAHDFETARLRVVELTKQRDELRDALVQANSAVRDACHAVAIYGDTPPQMYLDSLDTTAAVLSKLKD